MSTTSLNDLPWIPVTTLSGQRRRVGLVELFTTAHELAYFDTTHPLELSALHRLTAAMSALIVREMGGRVPAGKFDAPAVVAVLQTHADALDLHHPLTPAAQEWCEPTALKDPVSMDFFRFEVPGESSKQWRRRGSMQPRWLAKQDLGVVALHLWVHWFHSVGGNSASLHDLRPQNGSIGTPVGNDQAFFWRGRTLADTFLANTPQAWVEGVGLPAFLDRHALTAGQAPDVHPLWGGTFTTNATRLEWDATGNPVAYRFGASKHLYPGQTHLPDKSAGAKGKEAWSQARKALYTRLREADPHRIWYLPPGAPAKPTSRWASVRLESDGPQLFTGMRPEWAPLTRLAKWYEEIGAEALTRRTGRHRFVRDADLGDGTWTLQVYFAQTVNKAGSTMWSRAHWMSQEPAPLDFDDEHALVILELAGLARDITAVLAASMVGPDGPLARLGPASRASVVNDIKVDFHRRAERAFAAAVNHAAAGEHFALGLPGALQVAAAEALGAATAPFCGGLTVPAVTKIRAVLPHRLHGVFMAHNLTEDRKEHS